MQSRFDIPPFLIWAVLAVCIIPAFVVFSYSATTVGAASGDPLSTAGALTYRNLWLFSGIACTFMLAAFALTDFIANKDLAVPFATSALLSTGIFQLVCVILSTGSAANSALDYGYQNWLVSSWLFIVLLAGVCWLLFSNSPAKEYSPVQKKLSLLLVLTGCVIAIVISTAVTFTLAGSSRFSFSQNYISHPLEFASIGAYLLLGLVILPKYIRRYPSAFSRSLLLSLIPAVFASLFMALHSYPADAYYNAACFLRFVQYAIPLLGFALNYLQLAKEEKNTIRRLQNEIKEHLHTRDMLRALRETHLFKDETKKPTEFLPLSPALGQSAENLLTECHALLRQLPNSAVLLFDEGLNLVSEEGELLSALGTDAEQSIEKNLMGHREFLQEALTGKDRIAECMIDGQAFRLSYRKLQPSGLHSFRVLLHICDITDLKRNEHGLEDRIAELLRSNADLEQFAYIASHDLQEPLRKIRSFGERLAARCSSALSEEALDYIGRMRSAAERMQGLIDDLLTLSRISRPVEQMVPLNLSEIIRDVLYDLELAIEKKRARIEVRAGIVIEGIPSQLHLLFQNIISNSLKFSRTDIPLLIKINAAVVEAESISRRQNDRYSHYCQIEISDNGIGFSQEHAESIFNLFQRLHSRSEFEGSGIGLALCRKIVENHSGYIEASGEENQGAIFRIFVPLMAP